MGESLLHMEQYSPIALEAWQIQPIHNYFLLSAAELGILGALILIWILISHLSGIWGLFRNSKFEIRNSESSNYRLLLFTILLCFLVLMQFDHYFYTLQQTQMLLWIILGLIAAETSNRPQTNEVTITSRQTKKSPAGDLTKT